MAETDRDRPDPTRPQAVEAIRFFDSAQTPERADMSETRVVTRTEPILDVGPPPLMTPGGPVRSSEPVRSAEPVIVETRQPAPELAPRQLAPPEPPITYAPVAPPPADRAGPSEQLARLEDKSARIEEKLARSESNTQRVVDRFELASARMGEVALQSDLAAVRGEVSFIARRMRNIPGFTALVFTAIITAALTSAMTVVLFRYLPQILGSR